MIGVLRSSDTATIQNTGHQFRTQEAPLLGLSLGGKPLLGLSLGGKPLALSDYMHIREFFYR